MNFRFVQDHKCRHLLFWIHHTEGEQNVESETMGFIIERSLWDLAEIRRSSQSFPIPQPSCSFLDPFGIIQFQNNTNHIYKKSDLTFSIVATFAYLCFPAYDSNQATLSKIQLERFEILQSISFPYNSIGSAIVDWQSDYGYFTSQKTIYKIDLSKYKDCSQTLIR